LRRRFVVAPSSPISRFVIVGGCGACLIIASRVSKETGMLSGMLVLVL
jgi:hypothetical protein